MFNAKFLRKRSRTASNASSNKRHSPLLRRCTFESLEQRRVLTELFAGRTGDLITIDFEIPGAKYYDTPEFSSLRLGSTFYTQGTLVSATPTPEFEGIGETPGTGRFYYAPDVRGLEHHLVGNVRHKSSPEEAWLTSSFQIDVYPKYSTEDQRDAVTAIVNATDELSVARQQQRLKYLGFPDDVGNPLVVDGKIDAETKWAIDLFNGAVHGQSIKPQNSVLDVTWANRANAPVWREFPPGQGYVINPDVEPAGATEQSERWGTSWAYDVLQRAGASYSAANPGKVLGFQGASLMQGGPTGHEGHQSGIDFDIELAATNSIVNPFFKTWSPDNGAKRYIAAKTAADPHGSGNIVFKNPTTGALYVGENTGSLANALLLTKEVYDSQETLAALRPYLVDGPQSLAEVQQQLDAFKALGASSVAVIYYNDPRTWSNPNGEGGLVQFEKGHGGHFHVKVATPSPGASAAAQVAGIFNSGLTSFKSVVNVMAGALNLDLPFLDQSPEEMSHAGERLGEPLNNQLSVPSQQVRPTVAQGEAALAGSIDDFEAMRMELESFGFQIEQLDVTPDGSGDLMRLRFERTWAPEGAEVSFSDSTGFDYFDGGVSGSLGGSLTASVGEVVLSLVMGVDISTGSPTFYVGEESSLTIDGISVLGSVDANLGIRNLLDVDVEGPLTANVGGSLTFEDDDIDNKLRVEQFAQPQQILQIDFGGNLEFRPNITATLPIIGPLSWTGLFGATLVDGNVDLTFSLQRPSESTVTQLFETAFQAIAAAFDPLGGTGVDSTLPAVDKSLGELLGLPEFITGGGVNIAGVNINVTPQTVIDLINGDLVDLVRFESRGGDSFAEDYSIPLAAAAIPLGPVPLTVVLSFNTHIEAGWKYFIGLGIDTAGFYIDQATSVSAYGAIEAGLQVSVSILALAGMDVTAGVGASLSLDVTLNDPDPRDGRIYLDELLTQGNGDFGAAMLQAFRVNVSGEAYGFAKGVVNLLFWSWEVFNERFTIAEFGTTLAAEQQSPRINPTSQRAVTGRTPLGRGVLPEGLVVDGVLTIDTLVPEHANNSNTVSVSLADGGGFDVIWRGVGHRIFEPGEINRIVYLGNSQDDRLFVGEGILVPVEAHGGAGQDVFTVKNALAFLYGDGGNDTLNGGSAADRIWGGEDDDQITGGEGDDVIYGEAGDDRISGDAGHDQLWGGAGVDVLTGGSGNDTIDGGSENDILYGGFHDDTLDGGTGEDVLYGEQGADTLHGGVGNDTLIGGAHGDTLYGGEGDDSLFGDRGYQGSPGDFDDNQQVDGTDFLAWQRDLGTSRTTRDLTTWNATFSTSYVSVPDGNDVLYGQDGDDRLYGEGGDDRLEGDDVGHSGVDMLVGDAGRDELFGRGGADRLFGGRDDDLLHGGDDADVLNGQQGNDTLFGDAGDDTLEIDFATADGVSADEMHGGLGKDQIAVVGATGPVNQVGSGLVFDTDFDDYIQLEQLSAEDFRARNLDPTSGEILDTVDFTFDVSLESDIEQLVMVGLGGDDTLEVLTGPLAGKNIILDGGDGNDTLLGGQGRDTLKGGVGNDKLFGGDNDDVLYGGDDNDELDGGAGVDSLYGERGDDYVSGGAAGVFHLGGGGRDLIYGGEGKDFLIAGAGFYGSIIKGGDGDDTIVGSSGNDLLDGENGNDTILGGDLGDVIYGGFGNDYLIGELGRDIISGGDGNDRLYTHVNNEVRARIGLPPVGVLTAGEIQSRYNQLVADLPALQSLNSELLAIPESQRTDAQVSKLASVQDAIAINQLSQLDLLQYQSVYVDTADGGNDNDTIFGSPNLDVINGGNGDDAIHASTGFSTGGLQRGDIVKGDQGTDTLWYEGTDGDDRINIFTFLDGATGNRYVAVDLNGDGVREGVIQELTIENVGVRSLSGDDVVSVDFGNLDLAGVIIEGGPGDDVLGAPLLQSKVKMYGGSGHDRLTGGTNSDDLYGDSGDDQLFGGGGADVLDGGEGNDELDGGAGDDYLSGGLGNDALLGFAGLDRLIGGIGVDRLEGGADDDVILADTEDLVVDGGSGQNSTEIRSASEAPGEFYVPSQDVILHRTAPLSGISLYAIETATANDGTIVVTWAENNFPQNTTRYFAQRLSQDGQPLGPAFITREAGVGVSTIGVAISDEGIIAFAWEGDSKRDVEYRLFSTDGIPLSEMQRISSGSDFVRAPRLAASPDGFLLTWLTSPDTFFYDATLKAARLDLLGQVAGGVVALHVPDNLPSGSYESRFAVLGDDGGFAIILQPSSLLSGAYLNVFNSNNELVAERWLTSTETQQAYRVHRLLSDPGRGYFVHLRDGNWLGIRLGYDGAVTASQVLEPWTFFVGDRERLLLVNEEGRDIALRPYDLRTGVIGEMAYVDRPAWHASSGKILPSPNGFVKLSYPTTGDRLQLQIFDKTTVNSASRIIIRLPVPVAEEDDSLFSPGDWDVTSKSGIDSPEVVSVHKFRLENGYQTFILRLDRALAPGEYEVNGEGVSALLWGHELRLSADADFMTRIDIAAQPSKTTASRDELANASDVQIVVSPLDGSTIRVWTAHVPGSDDRAIYRQHFTRDGIATSGVLRVDLLNSTHQADPTVAIDRAGRYSIAWSSLKPGTSAYLPYFRRFASDGTPLDTQQVAVGAVLSDSSARPQLAMAADGSFVIVWQTQTQSGQQSRYTVFAQRYTSLGQPTGVANVVEAGIDQAPNPRAGMNSAGDFLVVWESKKAGGLTRQWHYVGGQSSLPSRVSASRTTAVADTSFAVEDWDQTQVGSGLLDLTGQVGGVGDGEMFQEGTIGIENTQNNSFQFLSSSVLDPFLLGGIESLDYSFWFRSTVLGLSPAIRQGGVLYWAPSLYSAEGTSGLWAQRVFNRVAALDFEAFTQSGGRPDFSADGLPIEVGYLVALSGGIATVTYGVDDFNVAATPVSPLEPSNAVNSRGEAVVAWRQLDRNGDAIVVQRFDARGEETDHVTRVTSSNRILTQPDIAIDDDGNFVIVWAEEGEIRGRWFDRGGAVLHDEFVASSLALGAIENLRVAETSSGDFVITWVEKTAAEATFATQRYTLTPPTVLGISIGDDSANIIVAFSQEMATSGAGSVLAPANWALRLPDGRYLSQIDSQGPPTDPRATAEQFGAISFAYNATSQKWEATLPLNFVLSSGTYTLIARSSLQDAAGRGFDGDGDKVPGENFSKEFTAVSPGDFDDDGDVDGADFLAWQRNVNVGLLEDWRVHFGSTSLAPLVALANGQTSFAMAATSTSDSLTSKPDAGRTSLGQLQGLSQLANPAAAFDDVGLASVDRHRAVDLAHASVRSEEGLKMAGYQRTWQRFDPQQRSIDADASLLIGDVNCDRSEVATEEAFASLADEFASARDRLSWSSLASAR